MGVTITVHARPHQLGRYLVDPVAAATSITPLHDDASSFHVPTLAEALCERLVELCGRGRRARKENADAGNFGRLLPSGTTGRQHAGDDRDEDDEGRARHSFVSSVRSGVQGAPIFASRRTLTVSGRGKRMRASGPLERDVRRQTVRTP